MATGSWQNTNEPIEPRPLDSKMSSRLEKALRELDQRDESFASHRSEERVSQMVKRWRNCSRMVESSLRAIARALHESHQVALDMGVDGVAQDTTPWVKEIRDTFPRLEFQMDVRGEVHALTDGRRLGHVELADVDYDWLEKMVFSWLVIHAEQHD